MVAAWKTTPERSKQISAAMRPFRVIQKNRSNMVITTESYCMKMIHALMQEKQICNARQNRDPIWSVNKCQSYIVSLFVEITAPKDFLVRETEPEGDGVPELHIYDGSNRLHAIYRFMENEFPITFGTMKVYYCELPACDRNRFDKILAQFLKLTNCPVVYACEIAEKRNEGTPMTIGEKTTLLRSIGTPRSSVLEAIMNVSPFMDLSEDRASGLKVVAQLIQSIESKHGVGDPSFKLTDYHMECMRNFYKSDAPLEHMDAEEVVNAFLEVGDMCPDGQIPDVIKCNMSALSDKKGPTRSMFFYLSVVSLVMAHLRSGTLISEESLGERFVSICERSQEAKAEKRTFTLGGNAIEGLY
jgi:hypothetical protein